MTKVFDFNLLSWGLGFAAGIDAPPTGAFLYLRLGPAELVLAQGH